jgi:eukaryotic-like serine/threonine-protein kinase
MIGQTVSHYRIVEKLGEGGMGVVYKAEDLKLTRTVALKFLPHALRADEPERVRFLQEARAAAILNHPNICTIHDIQEFDEHQFIVMEYVEGRTLRVASPMQKMQEALACAIAIGEALQEAHNKGIVHRDVKADNIMLNGRNQVKVMDFGLAKLKGSLKLTQTSSTVGTLAYMAPEQLHGGEVDARSDIFSFGAVLFEMLTGRMPFKGEHEAAVMYSIVNEPPESLLKYRPDLPAELERIIDRALEKDPEDRYQHVDDMVSELRRINKQSTKVSRRPAADPKGESLQALPTGGETVDVLPPKASRHSLWMWSVFAGIVVVAVAVYLLYFTGHRVIDSIAVLPFVNASADSSTEYLSDGITESLINGLSGLPNLGVMSRSSVFRYKGRDTDPQEVGKALGVKAVLIGRVSQRGDNLLISTELVEVSSNRHIWGDQYNRKLSDILNVQEEIARDISRKLSVTLGGEEEKKLTRRATENTQAYQLYLKGRFYWNKRKADDFQKAIEQFNQAIEIDPNFALAYAGLASSYVLLPEYAGFLPRDILPKAKAAAQKAAELDPALAEPHAVLGLMKFTFEWDWEGAEREFKRAIEVSPNYPTTHQWYSECLRLQGKSQEALAEITRAQELDPLSPIININMGESFAAMHQEERAIEQFKKVLELDPMTGAMEDLGMIYAHQGNLDAALSELRAMRRVLGEDKLYGLGSLGFVSAKAGNNDEALAILNRLLAFAKKGSAVSVQIAMVHTGLGEKDKAFQWLEKGYSQQESMLTYLKIEPVWDDLRSDPRFTALLRKIRLEK